MAGSSTGEHHLRRKADVLALLRGLGVPETTIEVLDAELGDPVDLDRDESLLASHGVTRGRLVDRMGGSP
jgi:hypothetical protein